jgi:hypothetical protein
LPRGKKAGFRRLVEPDWPSLAREAKRPGFNLMVLWEEYREASPDGYGYSRYVAAELMRRRQGKSCFPWRRRINSSDGPSDYRVFRNVIRTVPSVAVHRRAQCSPCLLDDHKQAGSVQSADHGADGEDR